MNPSSPSESMSRMSSLARELVGIEVLVVDQDDKVQKGVTQLLSAAGLHVTAVGDPESALAQVDKQFFSVMLIDIDTPAPGAGIETIREIKRRSPTSMLVALTPRRSF